MKKLLLSSSLFALFMTAFLAVGTPHAAAASWCGVMANPTNPNSTVSANCINGQNYTALNGLGNSTTPSNTLKANFKSYINTKSASGYGFQKVGAKFIKDGLDGGTGTWATRIDNPAVTFKMETFNSCGTAWPNTAYDINKNKVVNDPTCKLATPALVIRVSGIIAYAIKVDCGNPMGDLRPIPNWTPIDWLLKGTSTVSAGTAKRNATVTFKHTVRNSGPNTASYVWNIEKNYAGAGWSSLTAGVNATAVVGGSNPNAKAYSLTIPANAVIGSTYCQRVRYTNATGPGTGFGYSAATCVRVVVTPVVVIGCPNLPGVNQAAVGGVSFPTDEPNDPVPSSPSNGTRYFTRPVIGRTLVSARDAYTGIGLPVNGAALTVDFRPAVAAYPYDSQLANVTYTNTYQLYSHTWVVTSTNIYNKVTKKWVLTPTGGYWLTGGGSRLVSRQYADGSARMGECYQRNFVVTDVSTGTINFDDSEDPTNAQAGGSIATVAFDYEGPNPGSGRMRAPMQVWLNYSYQYDNGCASGGSFIVNGGFSAGTGTGSIPGSSCATSAPPLQAGDQVCISYTVRPADGQMTSNGIPINGGNGSVDSGSTCVSLVDKPYAHFFGLDVSAGGNFAVGDDKCLGSSPALSGIAAFVKGAGPLTRGSAVQYGALALGTVSGFGSASLRPSLPTARDGLTFANAGIQGRLGTPHCVPDYFSTKPAPLTRSIVNPVNLQPQFSNPGDPANPQQFWYGAAVNGKTTINGFTGVGAGIAKGNRIAIYVSGDAYITQDIKFKQSTSWASPDDVPSFYLVATGNIYIDPNVSQLDGVYVAQTGAAGSGTINTCAPGFGAYSAATLYDNCTNQLTVNGAFVAQKVNLYRTFGSLRNSLGGESPLNLSGGDCTLSTRLGQRTDKTYDCAAEVFNFSPETFLGKPALGSAPGSAITKYDFITSLSPVL